MGFFFVENKKPDKDLKGLDPAFLKKHGCNVCPLNTVSNLSPKMEPTGGDTEISMLIVGEAPSKVDDEKGKQFVGKTGNILRNRIPDGWSSRDIRWSNSVNCRPPGGRVPETVEYTCCYNRLVADVEKHKPKAILGCGTIPLLQIVNPDSKHRSISLWRGRKVPVKIGNHACWYFPIHHPSYIQKLRKYESRDPLAYGSDEEFAFARDILNAFDQIDLLDDPDIHSVDEAKRDIELVEDIRRIADLLNEAAEQTTAGVDIETNCLHPYMDGAKILTIGVSTKMGTFAFPVDHPGADWTELERSQLDRMIRDFLYEARCKKIVHHLPFELEWFGHFYGTGCFYAGVWECSESQGYVLDGRRGALSLDFLCFQYFGINLKAISGLDRKNLEKSPLDKVLLYQGIDARYHRLLYLAQLKRLKAEKLLDVYRHQKRRLFALVLAQMQGVPVDQLVVAKFRDKYEKRAENITKQIDADPAVKTFERKKGRKFNPSSALDVNFLFKEILKEDLDKFTKGDLDHVDHPIAKLIVQHRECHKVLSTYILIVDETEDENVLFPDGMMHPTISSTVTITWRTGSNFPNIQNWPKRDEERKEVRAQVRHPNANMRIVSFDYAGIQARNVAMESKDKALVEAYWNNYDIHKTWMETINKHYPKWISKSDLQDKDKLKAFRHLAKNKFVFPSFFGAQSYSISESLNIPENIIKAVQEEFFDQFHDIAKWHKGLEKFYYKNGYVTGLSGWRRYAPISSNERINTPIQSDESIIVMDAMNRMCERNDPRYIPMLMVHDDLTFCWPKNEIEKRAEIVIHTMITSPFEWTNIVPLEVEMSVGTDWISQKEVGKFANNNWGGIVQLPDLK